jgi:hypothetical protein
MRTNKNCTEKIQEARKTHQSDHAEATKFLHGAADVLEGRGEARGEEDAMCGLNRLISFAQERADQWERFTFSRFRKNVKSPHRLLGSNCELVVVNARG